MGKNGEEMDRILLAPELVRGLDGRWVNIREGILDGEIDPLDGLKMFGGCVETAIGKLANAGTIQNGDSSAGELVTIDLGDDEDRDPNPTEPKLLARVDLRRICRVADDALEEGKRPAGFDPVDDWRMRMQKFYEEGYGFHVVVPRPAVTREELADWRADGSELFFRPAESVVSWDQLMRAFGHENHWTVRGEVRKKIRLEPAETGYWFLAEAREGCPRVGQTYEDYARETPEGHQMISLEEYTILWHVMKDILGAILDLDSNTLLRTHFSVGEALLARGAIDKTTVEMVVRGWGQKITFKKMGTRFSRVVQNAA